MNQRFKMLKFRTMTVNAHSDSKQATRGDARVTKIGAFLRRTSIDELPQFWNVLWGTMSVVGPRPHMLSHTKEYSELISHYLLRQKIKPGITGWAQIHGYRGPTSDVEMMRQRVHHDVWYLDNWSILTRYPLRVPDGVQRRARRGERTLNIGTHQLDAHIEQGIPAIGDRSDVDAEDVTRPRGLDRLLEITEGTAHRAEDLSFLDPPAEFDHGVPHPGGWCADPTRFRHDDTRPIRSR